MKPISTPSYFTVINNPNCGGTYEYPLYLGPKTDVCEDIICETHYKSVDKNVSGKLEIAKCSEIIHNCIDPLPAEEVKSVISREYSRLEVPLLLRV